MKVIRTEQMWIGPDDNMSYYCHLSKNLWNEGNYIVEQGLYNNGKWIRHEELNKILNRESGNYKILPSQTANRILYTLDKSWKAYFNVIRDYKINPDKYEEKPKSPKYKKKNGEHILLFTNQQCKIKDGVVKLPKMKYKVETRLSDDIDLREVRIIPKGTGYVCEIVYNKEVDVKELDKNRIVGIDFGISNIVTIVNNIGLKSIIIKDNGTGIKSINQFYNKRRAELNNIYDKQKVKDGYKMRKLEDKRDRKSHDYVHKLSRFIVDLCVEHDIGTIVFGYNEKWKQNVDIGKRNNQNFVFVPYNLIIEKTRCKAEELGIDVVKQEESYTSKCSFLDNESIEHHDEYAGRRFTRSLFRSAKGTIIHSDVNGGYNIVRKAKPEAFNVDGVGGCGLHPVRCKYDSITRRGLEHVV
ncbi:MAG: IS200/IS605 family element transposase accessory protein TnpB [Methanosarcinales archaeon]|uniref:IS200/IS605 family element transposase accessory protein TnpB n=1 Tax=Candidatus Ethanoperedens thermophilum TaxID=2766897 RepID=A0A848D9Q1_9EURY|nr:IS200/IS605 family element transposase accessory protein TnpB [Candidatus Ethanoperedens thermophilum]